MIRTTIIALMATALMSTAAGAAQLNASGAVQVNRGDGYKAVAGSVAVRAGDRILVGANGRAELAYSSSCVTTIGPNASSVVISASPCEGRMNHGRRTTTVDPTITTNTAPVIDGGTLAFGALVAGGIAGVIINSRNGNPASP